jgi:hypothetical protein
VGGAEGSPTIEGAEELRKKNSQEGDALEKGVFTGF